MSPAAASELRDRTPFRDHSAHDAIILHVEQSIGPWERPEDVIQAAYRVGATVPDGPRPLPFQAAPAAGPQNPPPVRFDIPPGPLAIALRLFEQATNISVRVSPDLVRTLTSPGVRGMLTADQALSQILADSQLSHRFSDMATVVVEVRPVAEFVDVTAAAQLPAVTSPKFTAPLLYTPQTITVIPKALIEAQGATSLRDVLRNVPGITMQAGEGGGGLPGDTLTIRGFSASNDIFVDGVRDAGPYGRDTFNIEQVEVFKGPSSAFGGRGSTGGAINMATKSAGIGSIRQGTVAVGNAGHQRTTVDLNERLTPLGERAAIRLNAMWQDAGVPGRDVVNNRSWGVAPSLGLGIGGPSRFTLSYQHFSQDNVPDYGLPWGTSTDPVTGEVFPTGAFKADPAVDQRNFYGLEEYDFERIRNDMATARIEQDFTGLTLRNITRYGDTTRNHAITAPRPPNRQLQRRDMANQVFANQTSLSTSIAAGGLRHDIAAGFEAAREVTGTENSSQTVNQPQTNLRDPNPFDRPFGTMPVLSGNPSEATTRTLGAYVFDTIDLAPAWELTAGLRWDRSEVDFEQLTRATGVVTELGRTDAMLSWRGGVVYKPRPNGSVYLGYGTSFNPASDAGNVGTALSGSDTAVNSVNLEPEKSRNFEVGTKWAAAGDRLALTGAFFHTEKTNARTRNLTSDPFVLAGRQRVQGIELGATGRMGDRWTAFAAYSHMDSKIVDSASSVEAGRDLALTPENTASVWLTRVIGQGFTVGGGFQYMDVVFRNTTTDLQAPSYWLVNATAEYAVNSHLTLRFNGTNLTNVDYADRVGGGHYVPGPQRSVQFTTSLGF